MSNRHTSEAMLGAVGREISRQISFPVSESDIRKWALAVYYPELPPSHFLDPAAAAGEMIAPEEFNPFNWLSAVEETPGVRYDPVDPDRTEIMLGIEGPHLRFQMNGGMESEYGVPMRPGDVITAVKRLTGYREREGRLGLMLFTFTEDTWTNQRGEMVKITRSIGIRY